MGMDGEMGNGVCDDQRRDRFGPSLVKVPV